MNLKNYFDFNNELINVWSNKELLDCIGWPINYNSLNKENDMLYLNSRYYNELINNVFLNDYENCFNTKKLAHIINPILEIHENSSGIKKLRVSYLRYFKGLIALIRHSNYKNNYYDLIKDDSSINNYIKALKLIFKDERSIYYDVLNNNSKSIYYSDLLKEYNAIKSNNEYILFDEYIKSNIDNLTEYIVSFNGLKDIFQRNIIFNIFIDCFNYDQLMMIIAKSFIDYLNDLNTDNIDSCYIYLIDYFNAIKRIKENYPNYNCVIKYSNNKIININDLLKEYNELKNKINEEVFNTIVIDKDFIKRNNLDSDEYMNLNLREFKELLIMIHNKELLKETNKEEVLNSLDNISNQILKTKDESLKLKLKQQKEKIEFLLNNKPIKILQGTNTFSNYYGYLYKNGYVVFDVINSNINKSYGNAMYIISYNKINEYNKLTKSILRKSDYEDVYIIMHSSNWKERIINKLNELEDLNINLDDIKSIDIKNITSLEELNKIKSKLLLIDSKNKDLIEEKQRRIKLYKEIDNELKNNNNKNDLSKEELDYIADELINKNIIEFDKLYNINNVKSKRNPAVVAITKLRSRDENGNYTCELCHTKSYFANSFDAHHMIELSKGGIDNIYNTVCLCPNCHRDYHLNRLTYNQLYELYETIRKHLIECNIEYLPLFEEMINPNAKDIDFYLEHKEEIDIKFAINWNYTRKIEK